MKIRQKILRRVYPAFIKVSRALNMQNSVLQNRAKVSPPISFYDLQITLNNGTTISCNEFRNMKVLIVNTASDCGYTPQYEELQQLYREHADAITVIGFPSNDFREQEKKSDSEIAEFCKVNFGVTFPLARKCSVLKGMGQDEVFRWLSSSELNGWNDQEPRWNFAKYLIDEKGKLMYYLDPAVSPLEVAKKI